MLVWVGWLFLYLSGVTGNTAGHCPIICRRGDHVSFVLFFFFLRQLSRFISLFACLGWLVVFYLSGVAGNTAEYCPIICRHENDVSLCACVCVCVCVCVLCVCVCVCVCVVFETAKQVYFLVFLLVWVGFFFFFFLLLSGMAGNTAGHCPLLCRRGDHVFFSS